MTSKSLYSFECKATDGKIVKLNTYAGSVALVVNVASQCGFTPQYEGLELLYEKFKDRGFVILAFPCNQFGAQEPGSDSEVLEFCQTRFSVKFPVMSKIDVNGPAAHPIYEFLKEEAPGILGTEAIKWNFTKFLVGKDGKVIKRYPPTTKPENIELDIQSALSQ